MTPVLTHSGWAPSCSGGSPNPCCMRGILADGRDPAEDLRDTGDWLSLKMEENLGPRVTTWKLLLRAGKNKSPLPLGRTWGGTTESPPPSFEEHCPCRAVLAAQIHRELSASPHTWTHNWAHTRTHAWTHADSHLDPLLGPHLDPHLDPYPISPGRLPEAEDR